MNNEQMQALIDNDLGFLNDIVIHELNGKLMMGDGDLPFNVAHIFREADFVKTWLMQFALGNDFNVNYFDRDTWIEMTNRGTQCALVVDTENKPVLMVRPLSSHNLSARDFELLRITSQHIQQIQADTYRSKDPNASMPAALMLKEQISAKRLTITDLVAPEFYAKYGIIPSAEKKVYYIKDQILDKKGAIEDINRSREILYKIERKEPTTREELKFLFDLTKGQFIVDGLEQTAEQGAPGVVGEQEKPSNPMEC